MRRGNMNLWMFLRIILFKTKTLKDYSLIIENLTKNSSAFRKHSIVLHQSEYQLNFFSLLAKNMIQMSYFMLLFSTWYKLGIKNWNIVGRVESFYEAIVHVVYYFFKTLSWIGNVFTLRKAFMLYCVNVKFSNVSFYLCWLLEFNKFLLVTKF